MGLLSKKILEIEMLGKPNQEGESHVVQYEPRARDPWGRHGKGFVTSGKLHDCLVVADLPRIGFLFFHPRYRRDQLN